MRLTRIHVPGPLVPGARIALPAATASHVARVLRMAPGDALRVFDGEGHEREASVAAVQRGTVHVDLGDAVENRSESPLAITLLQGVARGEKMDFILQKATELGIARIVPLLMARSTVKLDAGGIDRRHAHWQAVITAACGQCGRARVPSLVPATTLAAWLDGAHGRGAQDLSLLLAPQEGSPSLPTLLQARATPGNGPVTLLVGPEGGFDDTEVATAQAAGFLGCRLGPRILRSETAGLAAIAALQVLAGDWR